MKRRGGFTLLEIIVVLAILALGLATVTTLTTATTRQTERVEEETAVQTFCLNLTNSILAGEATVSIGVDIPIPEAPNWTATVELLDGPIENLVAIRITAQRYVTSEVPNAANPNASILIREPDLGRRFVYKEWARRADVRTRTLQRNLDGTVSAVDGTAETLLNANAAATGSEFGFDENGAVSQDLQGSLASPFSAVDAATGGFGGGLNGASGVDASLGGGLNGASGGLGGDFGAGANSLNGGLNAPVY